MGPADLAHLTNSFLCELTPAHQLSELVYTLKKYGLDVMLHSDWSRSETEGCWHSVDLLNLQELKLSG